MSTSFSEEGKDWSDFSLSISEDMLQTSEIGMDHTQLMIKSKLAHQEQVRTYLFQLPPIYSFIENGNSVGISFMWVVQYN